MDSVSFNLLIDKVKMTNHYRFINPWESKSIRKRKLDITSLRKKYALTQSALANILGVDPDMVKKWESGISEPKGAALHLLRIAQSHPELFLESLWEY
jgi:DNA-binding transcriptional regulator YiaG